MSSFLVSEKTIDHIVTAIWEEKKEEMRLGLPEYARNGELTKLGQKLIMLNLQALNQRYGDKIDEAKAKRYKWAERHVPPTQSYKSLNCFTYQCAEGNVVKKPLYLQLEKIEDIWARRIVSNLLEYNEAEWG